MENNQQESNINNNNHDKNQSKKTQNQQLQDQKKQDQQKPKKNGCFKIFLIILALIILLPIAYCQIKYPSYTYRYKMTVEVETPQGIKSGSSVVEVLMSQDVGWVLLGSSARVRMRIKGEGAFVDIADGKTLFVLLQGSPKASRPHSLMNDILPRRSDSGISYLDRLKNAKGILPRDKYPRMVYFEDINDPLSVKRVDPEDMEEFFGEGVKLKQIMIETTKDKLEWKMVGKLKWLLEYYINQLDGNRYYGMETKYKFANSMSAGSFSSKKE
ncbi:MAG: hypothetical protein ACI9TO_001421 [Rickettsiales bacterium]|jgi:hypothetical protein